MRDITPATNFIHTLMQSPPDASAWIAGGNNFPSISGLARFYATKYEGTLVEVEVFGLPNVATPGSSNFYGMHIHENGVCVSPFTSAGAHYSRTRPNTRITAATCLRFWATRVMPGWHFMTSVLRFRKLSENPSSFTGCRITLQRSPRATPANGLPAV